MAVAFGVIMVVSFFKNQQDFSKKAVEMSCNATKLERKKRSKGHERYYFDFEATCSASDGETRRITKFLSESEGNQLSLTEKFTIYGYPGRVAVWSFEKPSKESASVVGLMGSAVLMACALLTGIWYVLHPFNHWKQLKIAQTWELKQVTVSVKEVRVGNATETRCLGTLENGEETRIRHRFFGHSPKDGSLQEIFLSPKREEQSVFRHDLKLIEIIASESTQAKTPVL